MGTQEPRAFGVQAEEDRAWLGRPTEPEPLALLSMGVGLICLGLHEGRRTPA